MYYIFDWKSEEPVIFSNGEVELTTSQVAKSFQGAEHAKDLLIGFMKCRQSHYGGKINQLFLPPQQRDMVRKCCFARKFKNYSKNILYLLFSPKCRTTKMWKKKSILNYPHVPPVVAAEMPLCFLTDL